MREVLVADDDKAVLRTFSRVVAGRGYTPVETASGAEALRLASKRPFRAAILDGHLGQGVTGFEVCGVMKRGLSPTAAVFIVSGVYVGLLNRALARHHGAADYFEKPVPLTVMRTAFDAALAAPRAVSALPAFDPSSAVVLVVDPQERRCRSLVDLLHHHGYTVVSAARVEELRAFAVSRVPDCVLLHHGLAESCASLRAGRSLRDLPIIVTGAPRTEGAACLSAGADHFIDEGADPTVLPATLEALLRRRRLDLGIVAFGDLSLHPRERAVRIRGEHKATLAAGPLNLMCLLVERAAVPVSREELCERLGRDCGALERCMSRLREELGELSGRVQTSRGLGWTYVPQA